jgi:Domain of unknown function (DUF4191)
MPSIRLPGRRPAAPGRSTKAGGAAKRAKPAKPAKAKPSRAERRDRRRARVGQLRQAFTLTRRNDPRMLPIVLGVFFGVLALFVLLGVLIHHPIYFTIFGLLLGLLAAFSLFGRRAQRAALSQVEGQPGAAVAVIQSMRGLWEVTPVVAVSRNSDVVHRVIGRPGVILIGEGNAARLGTLLGQEKRRISRVASETPMYDIVIGEEDSQVPLRKLQAHLTKLPHNLKPAQVRLVEGRMRALGAAKPPVPQGPMPRNARTPRGRPR